MVHSDPFLSDDESNDDWDEDSDDGNLDEPFEQEANDERGQYALIQGLPAQVYVDFFHQGILARVATRNNDELLSALRRSGAITSDATFHILNTCDRGLFIPQNYANEAYIDSPIRVEEHGYNISAPHIHATAIEALGFKAGEKVLDVGCGCGIIAACAALMVGQSGSVVAMDIRPACIQASKEAIEAVKARSASFAQEACEISILQHDVFLPSAQHRGKYDAINVGGGVPASRVKVLLKLLKPTGGRILVPVASELLLLRTGSDGSVSRKSVSAVNFSKLEVPSDAQVLKYCIKEEESVTVVVNVPATSLVADLQQVEAETQSGTRSSAESDDDIEFQDCEDQPQDISDLAESMTPEEDESLLSGDTTCVPCVGGLADSGELSTLSAHSYLHSEACANLGLPDCTLVGSDWALPAHRALLQVRCEHFRALSLSGMRDAQSTLKRVPEGFTRAAVGALLTYVYTDELPCDITPQLVVELVHVALYYGTERCQALCEEWLAKMLPIHDVSTADPSKPPLDASTTETALSLLLLAHEAGLLQLRHAALGSVTSACLLNFPAVTKCGGWNMLPRGVLEDIMSAMATRHWQLTRLIHDFADGLGPDKAKDLGYDDDLEDNF